MKGGFIQYNGKFIREEQPIFSVNDLFRLGIGLRESFRAENNEILFIEEVYQHLTEVTESLNLTLPADFDPMGQRLRLDVSRLLNKNKLYLAARIILQLFPGNDGPDLILSAEEIPRGFFPLNENGLLLDIFTQGCKSRNPISNTEPGGRFIWMMAANEATLRGRHNMIILNDADYACEAIGCSFAFLKDDTMTLPSPLSGGYRSTLEKQVINSAIKTGYQISARDNITVDELLEADEMFLIDNCLGIQKVLGLNDRRYYSAKTGAIASKFTAIATEYRKSKMDLFS